MGQELAFAVPATEEITEVAILGGGALGTGLIEGLVVSMTPKLGALEVPVLWGTLVGVPFIGAAGAFFTRGMIGDLFRGVAAGGAAILGYSLPALIAPLTEGKVGSPGGGPGIKQLGQGNAESAIRNQQQAGIRSVLEF